MVLRVKVHCVAGSVPVHESVPSVTRTLPVGAVGLLLPGKLTEKLYVTVNDCPPAEVSGAEHEPVPATVPVQKALPLSVTTTMPVGLPAWAEPGAVTAT